MVALFAFTRSTHASVCVPPAEPEFTATIGRPAGAWT